MRGRKADLVLARNDQAICQLIGDFHASMQLSATTGPSEVSENLTWTRLCRDVVLFSDCTLYKHVLYKVTETILISHRDLY